MTRTKERDAGSAVPTVNELLAQRAQILGWLERLEEVHDQESRRVVDRVRGDYQARLQGVVHELSAHLQALRAELDGARERRAQGEERHQEADDALREARLRHRIGEIAAEVWEARRAELEAAVQQAGEERDAAAAEVERLEEVLAQIDAGVLAPAPRGTEGEAALAASPGAAGPLAVAASAPPEDAPEPEPLPMLPPDEETVPEPGPAEDLAFLEELDRAIAASAETEPSGEAELTSTGPAKGTKCPECGYTNDPDAWYCGVCGVDLA